MKGNCSSFNFASSKNVKTVSKVVVTQSIHKFPITSTPNTVIQNYNRGKLISERYFDEKGQPYLDIDYTNHGNPKAHPTIPHEHKITIKNGVLHRQAWEE